MRITTTSGSRHRHREAVNRGHAERPMSNTDVQQKFIANATRHFPAAHARAVMDRVLELNRLSSARALEDLLALDPTG